MAVYSGMKADTASLVAKVAKTKKENPAKINAVFSGISRLVEKAIVSIKKQDWQKLGDLFNQNQIFLEKLGVSTRLLNHLIKIAKDNGAFGAKLSGAGGGDCIIILYPPHKKKKITDAMIANGGEILDVL